MDGQDYWFVSNAVFDELLAADGLLEWAVVHGRDRYGTLAAAVQDAMARGEQIILEIDLQGARQVRAKLRDGWCSSPHRTGTNSSPAWSDAAPRTPSSGSRLRTARGELAAADSSTTSSSMTMWAGPSMSW